jgi:signal transduction histidine kinase
MFKKLTQLLSKSSNRLLSTTNNILTYSRSEQGSVDVVLMPVDLSELVSDLCSMLEIQAKAKGLTLTKELPPKLMAKVD